MSLTQHLPTLAALCLLAGVSIPAALGQTTPSHTGEAWRQFRGPSGQGVSRNQGLPTTWSATENVAWKTELPGPGASSPIVFGDHIYLTAFSGYAVPGTTGGNLPDLKRHVLCFQRTDGSLRWKRDIPATQPEQDRVRDHGYASSTPLADSEHLYVFLGKSGAFAFTHDGTQVWHADLGSGIHGWGSATSPVAYRDLVIFNASVESGALVALDRRTGREVWRANGMKESWNTPILVPVTDGGQELVVAIAGKVLGFDPASGTQLWSCDTGIAWYMVPSLVHDGDRVYCIGGRTGGGLAVRAGGRGDVTQTRRAWTLNKGSNVSSPLFHEGHLYFLHENLGVASCVEASSGNLIYEERIAGAGQFYPSPILADGRIYCVSRRGTVFVLAAKPQFELLARNELGDRSSFDASPAVDGNRLLLRSDRFLYCLGR